MKLLRNSAVILLFLLYLIAVVTGMEFLANIISPLFTSTVFIITFRSFVLQKGPLTKRLFGAFLSLGILVWAVSDLVWAITELLFHMDPMKVVLLNYSYSLTNLFFSIAFTIFGIGVFRKWNSVQTLLDTILICFCCISLFWTIFFDEDFRKFIDVRSDWVSSASIIMDFIIIIWVAIWYFSIRKEHVPVFLRLTTAGAFMYAIIDLIYYYEYFFDKYDPNSILDALYYCSFLLIALGGIIHTEHKKGREEPETLNDKIRKGLKGPILLSAPLILVIFKGFLPYQLLILMTVISIYYVLSYYIQNNIYKEELLKKEKLQNNILEKMVYDRTEELQQKNRELERMLNRDEITGMYNRRYFTEFLESSIKNCKENETILLLYIDINKFKMISTMFGYRTSDLLLRKVGDRLQELKGTEGTTVLASYGRDIFTLAVHGLNNYNHGLAIAQEAVRLCSDIYEVEDNRLRVTVNIGVSIYPYDAHSQQELIMHADAAMTQAKMQGFNTTKAFDSKLSEIMFRRNTIELMLKRAVFDQEFMLYFQPQVDTASKQVFGFEALLRWNTPAGEYILPGEFIPVAEETGLIVPLGSWVLHQALSQLAQWNSRSERKFTMGVNVSIKQLDTDQFIKQLKLEIDSLALKPEWIDIEITETLQLHENKTIEKMLDSIRGLGVNISIDDFGTGYSTLSYLRKLSMDRIKIARELISRIHEDSFDYQLVKSIITVAKVRGLRVIAEGVEHKDQYEKLKEIGCDEIQGYYFGRPIPVRDIEETFLISSMN